MAREPDGANPRHSLTLLVAGHTNVGKTSLLRTLGRTTEFGEVSPSPSTTRQVQPLLLVNTPELAVTAFDTPGLESSARLRELLEDGVTAAHDQPGRIRQLLAHPVAVAEFEQECRVLEQALVVDACLYVIDAREPVLEKYLDEIHLLAQCGHPVLPLLNFTAGSSSREQTWREALRKLGQHTVVAFDAAVYSWESERRLYRSLATVLPDAEPALEDLIRIRARETDWRLRGATKALADGLIDMAACEDVVSLDDPERVRARVERIRDFARQRERRIADEVMMAFNYAPEILGEGLHADYGDSRWRRDPFNEQTLRHYGIRAMGPVAAGAAAGGSVDLLLAGGSLGMGTAAGAITGLVLGAGKATRRAHRRLLRNQETVGIDDAVLHLIATRNLQLIATLQARGHGSEGKAAYSAGDQPAFPRMLPRPLYEASDHPEWSSYRPEASAGETTIRGGFLARTLARSSSLYRDFRGERERASREKVVGELQARLIRVATEQSGR